LFGRRRRGGAFRCRRDFGFRELAPEIGRKPAGKALKFVHRGPFEAMTQTYDAISHWVDEKQISTKELLIEEYVSDLLSTPPDQLVINIFVPLN